MCSIPSPSTCFGKLPTHSDFVRYNAGGTEVLAFDRWLQEGLIIAQKRLAAEWEQAFLDAPSYHFIFSQANAERFLVGVISPSQDTVGRKYPFLVAAPRNKSQFKRENIPLVPALFSSFFEQARLFMHNAETTHPDSIVSSMEQLYPPTEDRFNAVSDKYLHYLNNTTQDTFFTELWGGFDEAQKYLLFGNIVEHLSPKSQHNPSPSALGLKFPLRSDPKHIVYDVGFWIDMSLRLLGNPSLIPTCFWTVPATLNKLHLFLFFRQPQAKHFALFIQPDLEDNNLSDLEKDGADRFASFVQLIHTRYQSLLLSQQLSLFDLLERLYVKV